MSPRVRSTLLVALVTCVVLALFAVCLANALQWIGRPFSGLLVSENGIVVSMGRSDWAHMQFRDVPFSRVLAVDGRPVADGREVHARVAAAGEGATVEYTLLKGIDAFRLGLRVEYFMAGDFAALFLPFLAVGLALVLIGAWIAVRRPAAAEAHALFALCASLGVTFITSPDTYGPYWFTPLFLMSLGAVPPAFLHLALTYPRRWAGVSRRPLVLFALYLPFLALALVLRWSMPWPSIFLPLLYTVYLLAANAVLLYVGGLVFALIEGVRPREPVLLSLGAILGSGIIALSIVVTYPLVKGPVSPALLAVPLLVFPTLKGVALLRYPVPTLPRAEGVRSKLELLFVGALQVTLLTAVATFWAVQTWRLLTDDLTMIDTQNQRVERLLEAPDDADATLTSLREHAKALDEVELIEALARPLMTGTGSPAGVVAAEQKLKAYYHAEVQRLRSQAAFVALLSTSLVFGIAAIVLAGMMTYFAAIRVWLVRPIQALVEATGIIATGKLEHRIPVTTQDEFGSLGASINAMAASLAENQRKLIVAERFSLIGEMSAYVAHNIRNPLASIRVTAQAEMLARGAQDPERQSFTDIVTAVDRLESWVSDLLRNASPVNLERRLEDLNALLARCVDLARPVLAQKGLHVDLALGPDVGAISLDRPKIEQVMSVVLSNAAEASPEGSSIRIASARTNGRASVRIEDHGNGIPRERLDTLFTMFATSKRSGTGIGLALAQKIVVAHDGQIRVDSREGEGTVVEITLPTPEAS